MSQICYETIKITTTGSAGSAAGSAESVPIQGFLLDVYLDYHASSPGTTDLTVTDPTFGTIFTLSNCNTDGWYAPRKQTSDGTGVATGMYDLIPINAALTFALAQADALTDCITITLRYITP
jgi:hypothetical protein